MERDRPRWRIRISTLMLLVVIAALAVHLVVEPRRWLAAEAEKMRAENEARLTAAEAERARALADEEARRRKRFDDAKGSSPKGE